MVFHTLLLSVSLFFQTKSIVCKFKIALWWCQCQCHFYVIQINIWMYNLNKHIQKHTDKRNGNTTNNKWQSNKANTCLLSSWQRSINALKNLKFLNSKLSATWHFKRKMMHIAHGNDASRWPMENLARMHVVNMATDIICSKPPDNACANFWVYACGCVSISWKFEIGFNLLKLARQNLLAED